MAHVLIGRSLASFSSHNAQRHTQSIKLCLTSVPPLSLLVQYMSTMESVWNLISCRRSLLIQSVCWRIFNPATQEVTRDQPTCAEMWSLEPVRTLQRCCIL